MIKYKVVFENNKAIASRQVDPLSCDCVRIEYPNGQSTIMWLVVYAYNEQDSINVANVIIKDIGFQTGGKMADWEHAMAC